jgi:hypothetical protein
MENICAEEKVETLQYVGICYTGIKLFLLLKLWLVFEMWS